MVLPRACVDGADETVRAMLARGLQEFPDLLVSQIIMNPVAAEENSVARYERKRARGNRGKMEASELRTQKAMDQCDVSRMSSYRLGCSAY
jgi:hypothetical protein